MRRKSLFKRMSSRLSLRLPGRNKRIRTRKDPEATSKVNSRRITRSGGVNRDADIPDIIPVVREDDLAPATAPYFEAETVTGTGTGISTSIREIISCKEADEIVYTTQHARKRRSPVVHLIEIDHNNATKPDLEMEDNTAHIGVDMEKGEQLECSFIPSKCEPGNEVNNDSEVELEIYTNPSVSDIDTTMHENPSPNDAREVSCSASLSVEVNMIEKDDMDMVVGFSEDNSISASFSVVEAAFSVQAGVNLEIEKEIHNKEEGEMNKMDDSSAEVPLENDNGSKVETEESRNDAYKNNDKEDEIDKDESVGTVIESSTSDEEDLMSELLSSSSFNKGCDIFISADEVELEVEVEVEDQNQDQDQDCFNIDSPDEDKHDHNEDTRGTSVAPGGKSNSHGAIYQDESIIYVSNIHAHLDRSVESGQDDITSLYHDAISTLGDSCPGLDKREKNHTVSIQGQVISPLSQCHSADTRPWDEKQNLNVHKSRDEDEVLDMDAYSRNTEKSTSEEHECPEGNSERSNAQETFKLSLEAAAGEGEEGKVLETSTHDTSPTPLIPCDVSDQIELSKGITVTVCNKGSKYFGEKGKILYMTKMKAALDLGRKKPVLLNKESVIALNEYASDHNLVFESNIKTGSRKDIDRVKSNLQKEIIIDVLEEDGTRNVEDDYLLWELGTSLKVIAPSSKYKDKIGKFVGLTQTRKSVRIEFNDGQKPKCLKPTSVVPVSKSSDSGNDVEKVACNNHIMGSDLTSERKEEAAMDTHNEGRSPKGERVHVTSAQMVQDQSSHDPCTFADSKSNTMSPPVEESYIDVITNDNEPIKTQKKASTPSRSSQSCPLSEIRIEPNVSNVIGNVHSEWAKGTLVEIIRGKHKNKIGIFLKLTESQKSVRVQFGDALNSTILCRKTSVQLAKGSNIQVSRMVDTLQKPVRRSLKPSFHSIEGGSNNALNVGDMVCIIGGTHIDKRGEVIKFCPKTVKIAIGGDKENVKSVRFKFIKTVEEYDKEQVHDFRVPDHEKGGMFFGSRRVKRIYAEIESSSDEDSFITHILGRRIMSTHVPVNKKESEKPIEQTIVTNDGTFQLILSKLVESDRGGLFHKPKDMQYLYMQTDGPGLETISPKDVLESIADFSAISTRKAKARLELFASPAYKCSSTKKHLLKFLNQSIFGDIEEKGHVGCGFICEDLLVEILGMNATAERAICIQVRIFIPMKGVYKGMLMKKRITSGPKILLPDSMKKIPASKKDGRSENACLLVTAAGVDPSTTNLHMGHLPSIDPPTGKLPPKSFCHKELSTMLLRLLRSLSVPNDLAQTYSKKTRGKKHEFISHTFLRGVADPTGKIPPNFLFITGMRNNDLLGDSIFITRSPVIKASDGHMVQVLRRRPESMTEDEYEWLQKLPFGAVIFGFPGEGMLSMPERIANGDLDGDRYFVCWEKEILKHIKADEWVDKPVIKDDTNDTLIAHDSKSKPGGENWFSEVQEFLKDPSAREMGHLIGKLYKESEKAADADKGRFMRNPDAEALADAFYQALENGKHGTAVLLPFHLWDRIPKSLHQYLRDP